jgi:energy-coupling factor transporter ATP-binding protein EcfA2
LVAFGVAFGGAFGVAGGVALGVVWGVGGNTAGVIALGVALGLAGGLVWGAVRGVAGSVSLGVALSFALGLGVSGSVTERVGAGVAVIIFYFRAPFFFAEAPLQNVLFVLERHSGITTLKFAPVFHHELSYIPHPFLQAHLLLTAKRDSALVHRALDACAVAPGQRAIGRKVLARLRARELARAARERKFSPVVELEGEWLSGREGADPLLLGFAETARYLASAQATSLPYHRLQKLEQARKELHGLRGQLRSKSFLARAFATEAFPLWQQVTEGLLHEAELAAAHQIPNPFRAGEPLSPEEGREIFRGREDLIRSIEALLGEPGRGCSIALLGPRRCGKTSLLKMLPLMLPDAICVLFDLQDNPIDSPGAFFSALERRAREQVRRDRQHDLPRLPEGSPFETGSRWIESLDEWAGDRRILLCLDEFERLESLFPGSQRELLQLLGLLRGTIQHRRHIRILVSGAAPFDELDTLWNDHLINAREVRIGHLGESTTLELLRKPIPEFPNEAVPEEVARTIFDRTGGQPYLVQLYGSLLISRLNGEDRRQADLKDIPRVEADVLQQATYYFRNTYQTAPPQGKEVLLDLAFDRKPQLDAATRRWLRRRLLLTDEDSLSIPVFGAWLREEEAS